MHVCVMCRKAWTTNPQQHLNKKKNACSGTPVKVGSMDDIRRELAKHDYESRKV